MARFVDSYHRRSTPPRGGRAPGEDRDPGAAAPPVRDLKALANLRERNARCTFHVRHGDYYWFQAVISWTNRIGDRFEEVTGAVAVDGSGKVYVVGGSDATWGSPARAHSGGGMDAFVAILNSDGSLRWNTFLGTAGNLDIATAVTLDSDNRIYVAGESSADWGWAITNKPHAGGRDIFALKMSDNNAVFWHTFMGSSDDDTCTGIARDRNGNVYLSGQSQATWSAPRRGYSGGADSVVIKLNGSGNYQWHTFLGSSVYDSAETVAIGTTGNIYISGASNSSWGAPLHAHQGGSDGFVAKLDGMGHLIWNTFFGSTGHDDAYGIALGENEGIYDRTGNPYGSGHEAIFSQIASEDAEVMLWIGDNWYYREVDFDAEQNLLHRVMRDRSQAHLQPIYQKFAKYLILNVFHKCCTKPGK